MSTLSLVVVFIACSFNAIYAFVVQILNEDGQSLGNSFYLGKSVISDETKQA